MPIDPAFYDFRDELADELIRDLVGPHHHGDVRPDEQTLSEPPIQRYIAGMLFPRSEDTLDFEDGTDEYDEDDSGHPDPPVSMANARFPSAMAISFAVDLAKGSHLDVTVSASRYEQRDHKGGHDTSWERQPIHIELLESVLTGTPNAKQRIEVEPGLELFVRVRPQDHKGQAAITLGLINTRVQPRNDFMRDPNTYFQVQIKVASGGVAAFVDRSSTQGGAPDEDAASYRLLYRHAGNFAVGHGCSVEWTDANASPPAASEIRSTFTPSHDLLLADSNSGIQSPCLAMRTLTELPAPELINGLKELATGYRTWIGNLNADSASLNGDLATVAAEHLSRCREAADRIERGIRVLESDALALDAFRLANRAMLTQRARSVWLRSRSGQPDVDTLAHQWRPFQLAFILLNIEGIAEPESDDRATVDLLWFPTGGGKTEAYLGLIAFTIFLRRLKSGGSDSGLTVIMRYTLRLLTLQQFQRALLLICACETIRRARPDLGRDEISIALWVGSAATPNNLADAKNALEGHRKNKPPTEGDPVQVRECPWCGLPLSYRNYWVRDDRMIISCHTDGCEFAKGLPAFLVDSDVYKHHPTLMIATVDKFASLPWRDNMGDLFDVGRKPPELIIQDELHLITGPLGTLVGLYETAIDMLCERPDGVGPKIIASTATIRRAQSQIARLYASNAFQFPPPGLDARDSYFAREVPRELKGSRRYIGLLAPGTSHSSLLVRSYAGALQFADQIDATPAVKDPYWTLLGYFNSLRVLGGAVLQVRDDVPDRANVLAARTGRSARIDQTPEWEELTSRIEGARVPALLQRMSVSIPDPDVIDVILATNMISVGVDIDRLGLMAVMGQPQSSSEYIQSTSRVGRQHPGLVLVLFNANRSRDRSHYESFLSFHQALYRQVDASSVTPFSARARDRGLHAVLVGLLRACEPTYRSNSSAANVHRLEAIAKPYRERILRRVRRVAPDEADATAIAIDDFLALWRRRAGEVPALVFQSRDQPTTALLSDASQPGTAPDSTDTLWSLRDVDTESNLYLRKG